jgi:hypothetical protein
MAVGVLLDHLRADCLYCRDERHSGRTVSAYLCIVG